MKDEPTITVYKDASKQAGYGVKGFEDDPALEAELAEYVVKKWGITADTVTRVVEHSKISEFEFSDLQGNGVTEEILNLDNYAFMIVAYKLYGTSEPGTRIDSIPVYAVDTIPSGDTLQFVQRQTGIRTEEVKAEVYHWDDDYLKRWTEVVNPVMDAALKDSHPVFAVTAYDDAERIQDFRKSTASPYPFVTADDILLKTIIRSNPGVVLLKKGKVIGKWHFKKLPAYAEIKALMK